MKTAKQWFEEALPPEIAERAIRRAGGDEREFHSFREALSNGFYWGTDEENKYWEAVALMHQHYNKAEPEPTRKDFFSPFTDWSDGKKDYFGYVVDGDGNHVAEPEEGQRGLAELHLDHIGRGIYELEYCPDECCSVPVYRGEIPSRGFFLSLLRNMESGPKPTRTVTGHNPENVPLDKVPEGYRFLDEDEKGFNEVCLQSIGTCRDQGLDWGQYGQEKGWTYITKLTRAELREARGLEPEDVELEQLNGLVKPEGMLSQDDRTDEQKAAGLNIDSPEVRFEDLVPEEAQEALKDLQEGNFVPLDKALDDPCEEWTPEGIYDLIRQCVEEGGFTEKEIWECFPSRYFTLKSLRKHLKKRLKTLQCCGVEDTVYNYNDYGPAVWLFNNNSRQDNKQRLNEVLDHLIGDFEG